MSFLFAPPYMTILDEDGNPVSGGKLYFYATGTTTPVSVYAEAGLITPLANPVVADGAGRCAAVYLDSNVTSRCKTTTAAGATISDVDPIIGLGSSPSIPVSASTTEQLTGTNAAKFATPDSVAALWEQGSDVASGGTVSLGEGGYFVVTGTTTITDVDFATDKAGRKAWVKFAGILTLTHNASTLILPTGANITTAAGDTACFVSEGADAVRCVAYSRASGAALAGGSPSGSITASGYTQTTAKVLGRTTAATGAIEELSLSAVLDLIGSAAHGDVLYRGSSAWARLAAGTSGYVLTTNGASSNPAWTIGGGTPASNVDLFCPETWDMRTNGASTTTYGTTAITINLSAGVLTTTNYVSKAKRVYTASSALANNPCYCTSGSDGFYGKTGSHFKIRWGMERSVSDTRLLIGIGGTSGLTADPSARTNVLGLGKDAADTNLQIMHNDGAGACTKIDLGANFPATDGVAYDVEFDCAAGMGTATYLITRLDSAFTASGTISTNLPVDTTTGTIGVNAGTGPAVPGLGLRVAFMAAWARSNLV